MAIDSSSILSISGRGMRGVGWGGWGGGGTKGAIVSLQKIAAALISFFRLCCQSIEIGSPSKAALRFIYSANGMSG